MMRRRAGTGTLDMIRLCVETGLPEPEFRPEGEQFVVVLWRHWLTARILSELALNDRQRKAVDYVKVNSTITSGEYQRLTGAEARTATRDLTDLVERQVFARHGEKRGTYYALREK